MSEQVEKALSSRIHTNTLSNRIRIKQLPFEQKMKFFAFLSIIERFISQKKIKNKSLFINKIKNSKISLSHRSVRKTPKTVKDIKKSFSSAFAAEKKKDGLAAQFISLSKKSFLKTIQDVGNHVQLNKQRGSTSINKHTNTTNTKRNKSIPAIGQSNCIRKQNSTSDKSRTKSDRKTTKTNRNRRVPPSMKLLKKVHRNKIRKILSL